MASVEADVNSLVGSEDIPDDKSPLIRYLVTLGIKGTSTDNNKSNGAKTVISGSPQSVAVIEATATAACKWWSAGLGVAVAGLWASVAGWWTGQPHATQRVALWMAAIITAAAVIGIAYLLGSDVRGRAAASVATINARAKVGDKLLDASQAVLALNPSSLPSAPGSSQPAASQVGLVALAPPIDVNYIPQPSVNEAGWKAIALYSDGDNLTKYLVAKGSVHSWANASDVELALPPVPPVTD
jgi:hypothetical protein